MTSLLRLINGMDGVSHDILLLGKSKLLPHLELTLPFSLPVLLIASTILSIKLGSKLIIQAPPLSSTVMISIQLGRLLLPTAFSVQDAIIQFIVDNATGLFLSIVIFFINTLHF
jgi:hypothetical protein